MAKYRSKILCVSLLIVCNMQILYGQNESDGFIHLVEKLSQLYADQNEYAIFVNKVESFQRFRLKRTQLSDSIELKNALSDSLRISERRRQKYYVPQESVKEYARLFDRLRCTREKATLQCVYRDEMMGGQPYLVLSSLSVDSLQKAGMLDYRWVNENAACKFMIPAEDTPMAYFQHLVFQVYGEQFAMYWHALYDKREIILHLLSDEVEVKYRKMLSEEISDGIVKTEFVEKGLSCPIVVMNEDCCLIKLVESNHEKICLVTFRISRKSPWKVERVDEQGLVTKPSIMY